MSTVQIELTKAQVDYMKMTYAQFLKRKLITVPPVGIEPKEPHAKLFPFQSAVGM